MKRMEPPLYIRMYILILYTALCCILQTSANPASESYEAEYFTNVSLPCNFTFHNLTYPGIAVPAKRYWILPNTSVLSDTFLGTERFQIEKPDPRVFNLRINAIDDPDFGVYHCIMLWENVFYTVSAIRVGLNEHGPYYKTKLEEFERNLIIGCVSAGVVVLIILIGCIICRCRNKKRDRTTGLRDLDYYSTNLKGRQNSYNYAVNPGTPQERRQEAREGRELSVGEMYAKVNKPATHNYNDNFTMHSEHL